MRWYWWIVLWIGLSIVLAPIVGAWLGRISEHYPPKEDDV